jgi:hypothetical protein
MWYLLSNEICSPFTENYFIFEDNTVSTVPLSSAGYSFSINIDVPVEIKNVYGF